jgi:predicted AlkP superfamily pyrophosphatase or phosphodiesterase
VPTLTVPAHLSILAGVPPEDHGVFSDDLAFTREMAGLQPLFRRARDEGRTAVAFMSEEGPLAGFEEALRCREAFGLDSLTLTEPVGLRAVETARPALADPDVELAFVHVPDPDLAGHRHGFESPEYGRAVLRADSAVGQVIEAAGSDSTLVVITSDHGGGGAYGRFQHGSASPEDLRVPLLLWGGGVVPTELGEPSVLDVAPTVLWALGLVPPPQYRGQALLDAFGRNPAAALGM